MDWCKKDITPLLMHWSYVFLALTHRIDSKYVIWNHKPIIMSFKVASFHSEHSLTCSLTGLLGCSIILYLNLNLWKSMDFIWLHVYDIVGTYCRWWFHLETLTLRMLYQYTYHYLKPNGKGPGHRTVKIPHLLWPHILCWLSGNYSISQEICTW